MVGGKFFNKKNIFKLDPYNTFNWLMEKSEKNNLKSRFYFICGGKTKFDANYSVNNYVIKKLINQIKRRGHEVGIHPSYGCYLNPEQIQYEVTELKNIIGPEHKIGARMHYLRFKYPETLIYLDDANVEYDSTLGYAEHIGFRCGTSHEYTPFNPITQQSLSIKVLPLILMEGTLYHYMNLSLNEKTLNRVLLLKKRCQFFNGNFTILWHNSELRSFKQRKFYESIISS
ncbi:polysaccharide deacetylase family protein, partial [Acinetobacter pecorum]|uniref:polysaccharide deacetylase family protein n=1 Tax=Acinetobacter pecorum TaxID=2762215 RepID=UPI003EE702D0